MNPGYNPHLKPEEQSVALFHIHTNCSLHSLHMLIAYGLFIVMFTTTILRINCI